MASNGSMHSPFNTFDKINDTVMLYLKFIKIFKQIPSTGLQ